MASIKTTQCTWPGCAFSIDYLYSDIGKALVLLRAHKMRHEASLATIIKLSEGLIEMTVKERINLHRTRPKFEPPISLIPIEITEHTDQPSTEALVAQPSDPPAAQPPVKPTQGASDEQTAAVVEDATVITADKSVTPSENAAEVNVPPVEEVSTVITATAVEEDATTMGVHTADTPAIEESLSTATPLVAQKEPLMDEDPCRRDTTVTAPPLWRGRPLVRGMTRSTTRCRAKMTYRHPQYRNRPAPDAEQRPDARTDQPPSTDRRGSQISSSGHGMRDPASRHRSHQSVSRHRGHQPVFRHRDRRTPNSRPQMLSNLKRQQQPVPRRSWWYTKHQCSLDIGRSRQLKRPSVSLLHPGWQRLQRDSSNREANKTSIHASSPRRAPFTNHRGLLLDIFISRPAVRPRKFTGLSRPPEMNINTLKD